MHIYRILVSSILATDHTQRGDTVMHKVNVFSANFITSWKATLSKFSSCKCNECHSKIRGKHGHLVFKFNAPLIISCLVNIRICRYCLRDWIVVSKLIGAPMEEFSLSIGILETMVRNLIGKNLPVRSPTARRWRKRWERQKRKNGR